ncbi:hypothetical protein K461DRAFT_303022 [Myriangium duriaei CBS 260.36]|uniref:NmrA-like domain-containing protein n=1 Tax=Myriangium duriaei CBS 260.36 TaxID=1168546 RepID=A0A9P4IVH0_9PEZI|nr:hypothetical protein K461DRAFT_303022 [Myriangium duriaei CBS 260.36]
MPKPHSREVSLIRTIRIGFRRVRSYHVCCRTRGNFRLTHQTVCQAITLTICKHIGSQEYTRSLLLSWLVDCVDTYCIKSKPLAVFGATGQQGGSVVDYVLQDPKLPRDYEIRATREMKSSRSPGLSERVQVVGVDLAVPASVKRTLRGVHTVYIMTIPPLDGPDKEFENGKLIAQVEQYIRQLPVKSALFAPGFSMQNFGIIPFFKPSRLQRNQGVTTMPNSRSVKISMINAVGDTGKFEEQFLQCWISTKAKLACSDGFLQF